MCNKNKITARKEETHAEVTDSQRRNAPLPCKEPCARRSLWTPLWQVLRPAILRLAASDKRTAA